MSWIGSVRERARTRLTTARRGNSLPPFRVDSALGYTTGPVVAGPTPTVDDGIPRGVRIAGAWAWRLILFVAAAYLLIRVIAILHIVVIPVAVALLLAALFEPAVRVLRNRGINRSLAAGAVLVGGLAAVSGGLGLIVGTVISQFDDLSTQVRDGVNEVQTWLARGPLHISQAQLTGWFERLQQQISENQGAITSGALSTATTVGEVVAGFFLVLFTLFFFLRDGAQIWRFVCRLLPQPARIPVARAGHYSWHTLGSYVRATVLVAFVDAVGIGIGLAVLRVPLALPLAALVFLGAFVPVIGATLSGTVAVLVALVTQGPVTALIVLGVVIGVQQLEGHVLQPLIMGRAVALHPLAVILAIATGLVVAGIVGALVAVPVLAVANTAVRYLVAHPQGEPTPDREPPGTRPTDDEQAEAEQTAHQSETRIEQETPPPMATSVNSDPGTPAGGAATGT
ncbi:AI-2E family transporter [Plantactinospora sp. KLBMP9567]|uniref:AI-2E family transporter n=1 Tax=Plantactinospora sp. KLBMP9567 TaxID=3085900 RepID=UPI002981F9D8|nr:AI-2E family transporter [Plantactinospora sp. KLBMP9567]MDW5327655.1 AI-2E family transporter [Plantactinospora sp. KLBMP9567]